MGFHRGSSTDFGFRIQGSKGSYLAPNLWLPHKGAGIGQRPNWTFFDFADRTSRQNRVYSAGKWGEGEAVLSLIPGATSALITWMQTRDSDDQGSWASCLVDCARIWQKATDVKVRSASITFEPGRDVDVRLALGALKYEDSTAGSPSVEATDPFIFDEAAVEFETAGGGYASETNFERIVIDIDNRCEDMAAGMRLNNSDEPLQQYNQGRLVTVTTNRDFVDDDVFDDFFAGTESSMRITLTRGSLTCILTMPRIKHTEHEANAPATREEIMKETITSTCMGSVDGSVEPITVT